MWGGGGGRGRKPWIDRVGTLGDVGEERARSGIYKVTKTARNWDKYPFKVCRYFFSRNSYTITLAVAVFNHLVLLFYSDRFGSLSEDCLFSLRYV